MAKKQRFQSSVLQALIERLQRVQRRDEMTKEDADHLLTGAAVLNWQFFKLSEAPRATKKAIKRILWGRILDVMEEIENLV